MKMKSITVDFQRFLDTERRAKEALHLASKHDPDLEKEIKRLDRWCNRLFGRVIKLEKKIGKSR